MPQALILFRSSNFDGVNKLIYNTPGGISLKGKEVALHSFSFYNSFFNFSSALGNNQVILRFPVFSASVADSYVMQDFVWTINDGFYSFPDLANALQSFMLANKLALYNATTGKYMYFYSIFQNTVQYAVQFQSAFLPTASQATALGFSLMSGSPLRLNISTGATPLLVAPQFNFNAVFGRVVGFSAGSYPANVVSQSSSTYISTQASTHLSTTTPYINPIDCILLRCNIANNEQSIPNDLLSVTPISSSYGAITQYVASSLLYVPCSQTTVSKIEVQMCDQLLNPILQRDAEITMVLSIRDIGDR